MTRIPSFEEDDSSGVLSSLLLADHFIRTAILLIGSVAAFIAMVAFLKFGDARLAVFTSEFGEVAGGALALVPLVRLVRLIAAVKVPVALLFGGHAQPIPAFEIVIIGVFAGAITCEKRSLSMRNFGSSKGGLNLEVLVV